MKLSRQFEDEREARQRELALQAAGYRAWRNRSADGLWHVFWWIDHD